MQSLVVILVFALAQGIDNGLGVSPPMGWRSWNCYGGNVWDARIRSVVDAMVNRSRTVNGVPTSLLDLGYNDCGLDDNWQACGTGVDNSFHDAQGNPLINLSLFPDMKSMTDYGHSKGVTMGWYHNNCICSEQNFPDVDAHYHGDVNAIVGLGFDGVKLDGCGEFVNLTYWAQLLNATGKAVIIENCHWGGDLPTLTWCPFNFFRTSGDITNTWSSFFSNLQTTIKFQDYNNPLARPGCWAYPDMLEVGNMGDYLQERAHFGAWVIVSAPLILGFDLTNQDSMDRVWPIISNTEAIAVNQQWAGHPGMLVYQYTPSSTSNVSYLWAVDCNSQDPTESPWSYDASTKTVRSPDGRCLDATDPTELTSRACSGASVQQFSYNAGTGELVAPNGQCVDIYDFSGPVVQLYSCNGGCNQKFAFASDKTLKDQCSPAKCISAQTSSPSGTGVVQVWAKPQPKGAIAVFVINGANTAPAQVLTIPFTWLNITGSFVARDLWNHTDIGVYSNQFVTDPINGYDSRFYLFSPSALVL